MTIAVPFNNRPYSVAIKTASYSIPAGYYARVTVVETNADFTIGGTTAVPKHYYSGNASTAAVGIAFTNTSAFKLVGTVASGGGSAYEIRDYNTSQTITAAASIGQVTLMPGDYIYISTAVGGQTIFWELIAEEVYDTNNVFWVPTGTALDGTRYIVELYQELT